jgi:hypothetical protein
VLKSLTLNVTVFGDRVLREVVNTIESIRLNDVIRLDDVIGLVYL